MDHSFEAKLFRRIFKLKDRTVKIFIPLVLALGLLYSNALAQPYQLRVIADSTGPFRLSAVEADLNNKGEVAFLTRLEDDTYGIFTGADPLADMLANTTYPYSALYAPRINDNGDIIFRGLVDFLDLEGIFSGTDPSLTCPPAGTTPPTQTVVDNRGLVNDFNFYDLNNRGDVIFKATPNNTPFQMLMIRNLEETFADNLNIPGVEGFFQPKAGNTTVLFPSVVSQPGGIVNALYSFPLDEMGPADTTLIAMEGAAGIASINTASGNYNINDSGGIVYFAELDDGTRAILTGPDPATDIHLDNTGDFTDFGLPIINNNGQIAFFGTTSAFSPVSLVEGLFVSTSLPEGLAVRRGMQVESGETLSSVGRLWGFNDAGCILFQGFVENRSHSLILGCPEGVFGAPAGGGSLTGINFLLLKD